MFKYTYIHTETDLYVYCGMSGGFNSKALLHIYLDFSLVKKTKNKKAVIWRVILRNHGKSDRSWNHEYLSCDKFFYERMY